MKVSNDLQGLQQILSAPAVEKSGGAGGAKESAQAAVSDQATLSPAASLAAQAGPDSDVRMEKVAQVQQALAAGSYNVPSSAVADKMIDRMLGKGDS
jgi:negative regulator of flagellin synthesis FlgM